MLPSWVSSWCYHQMLDQTGKYLPCTNTLAYLTSSSAMKKKSFITLTPGQPVCEPEYVDSWHVKAMKALNRAQKESELVGVPPKRGASSTLPRPMSSEPSGRSGLLGERSKTLGPGFLRGHRFINGAVMPGQQGMGGRVESGYVSSPDGNFEFETSLGRVLPISGRFSSAMYTSYKTFLTRR
jgi:hypothetical protein